MKQQSQLQQDIKDRDKKLVFPEYTDEELEYLAALREKLEKTADNRNETYDEFDGLSYFEYYNANEKGANTAIKAVKNRGESQFQSGTLRTKLLAFLSTYLRLNLKPSITGFNEHEVIINNLGNVLEDIIEKTEQLEDQDAKEMRMLRQYELLKHGTVFVEDVWEDRWEKIKEVTKEFTGKIKESKWTTKTRKALSGPRRKILSFLSVFLGDYKQYFIENQPYVFTVEVLTKSKAKELYGAQDSKGNDIWEMWKYIDSSTPMGQNSWRLNDEIEDDEIEKIVYQSKPDNEIQILLNGIPMLPIGYPLSEVSPDGEYTIVQQNLEPIRHDFALGKSFVFKTKNIIAVLDEMLRLSVMKTKKSFLPPYLNFSDRVVSRDMFMPGTITKWSGAKDDFLPVHPHEIQGVTASEFNMVAETKRFIDENTVSPTTTGAMERGANVTATQIVELQRQARVMMGITELAASLLEKKLTKKRLSIILGKWFDPIDNTVDLVKKELKERYRIISLMKDIPGVGRGISMVVPSKAQIDATMLKAYEDQMEEQTGMPIRISVLNPDVIKSKKLIFKIDVHPKEESSSDYAKLMFDEMMTRAINIGQVIGMIPNPEYVAIRFAEVWDEDPSKLWVPVGQGGQNVPQGAENAQQGGQPGGEPGRHVEQPKIKPQIQPSQV